MPVQWVNRPNLDFRVSLERSLPEPSASAMIVVIPSGKRSKVTRVLIGKNDVDRAGPDRAVTVTLADEIDISRGDVICAGNAPCEQTDQFAAHILWMSEEELFPGRQYLQDGEPHGSGDSHRTQAQGERQHA
ncbi:MAG: hypothetical protein R3C54_15445 [Parvularculaceae bacterium]